MHTIKQGREFVKDTIRKEIDFRFSDQHKGVPMPPYQEQVDREGTRIRLPEIESVTSSISSPPLGEAIGNRKSRRRFTQEPLSLEELTFLLWATQGVRKRGAATPHFRTVPSAGARHSFETYLFLQNVASVEPGVYRYLPLSNELYHLKRKEPNTEAEFTRAVLGQRFVATGAAVFIWATVAYRMEWRYLQAAHRVILLDAGHICQNLYLACEAIDAGTCGIAAYDQQAMDTFIQVDGEEQFTVYLAPVGKI